MDVVTDNRKSKWGQDNTIFTKTEEEQQHKK